MSHLLPVLFRSILVWRIVQHTSSSTIKIPVSSGLLRSDYLRVVLFHQDTGLCKCDILYLLTPWCRVLLEKPTGLQLVKKFPAFHGTRRFITALTSVRHLSLSWASPIQSIYPHPTTWRFILILSIHLHLGLPRITPYCGLKFVYQNLALR